MSKSLHHSNLLVGASNEAEDYLQSLCRGFDIKIANNPDFFAFKASTFGIDEARKLKLLSTRKAIGEKKIFFISPERITLEAQNALLKTFEDPSSGNHFFLVVREEAVVIPTLLSRMQVIRVESNYSLAQVEKFLSLPLKDRLTFAKKFADDEGSLPDLLDSILLLLRKRNEAIRITESVYNIRRYAQNSSALPRMIIEHLSLVL